MWVCVVRGGVRDERAPCGEGGRCRAWIPSAGGGERAARTEDPRSAAGTRVPVELHRDARLVHQLRPRVSAHAGGLERWRQRGLVEDWRGAALVGVRADQGYLARVLLHPPLGHAAAEDHATILDIARVLDVARGVENCKLRRLSF